MDRLTAAVTIGVLALCALALGSVLVTRSNQTAPDLTTAEGVVTAYVRAIQNKEPSQAWALLAPDAAWNGGPRGSFPGSDSEAQFRQQVLNDQGRDGVRLRVVAVRPSGSRTIVDVESSRITSDPLFRSNSSQSASFELEQRDGQWRITTAPGFWLLR